MSIDFLNQITASEEAAYNYLRAHGVLKQNPPNCHEPLCQLQMTKIKRADSRDGLMFRCPKHKGRKCSIRKGSYFENNNLSLSTIVKIVYCWGHQIPNHTAEEITGLRHATLSDWYQHMRNVCSHHLVQNPYQIGGPGFEVQIDESHLGKYI